jgi:SAM-dependent methyltransferase
MEMNLIEKLHGTYVSGRRVRVLSGHLAGLIPKDARLLDVGCGDGYATRMICDKRPDVDVHGIDVLMRPESYIKITQFDGEVIPFDNKSFDTVMFVDVLHHVQDPVTLLREAIRVTRKNILIKDHILEGLLAGPTLRFMDQTGNARYGVALTYNYWPRQKWLETFKSLGLTVKQWNAELGLYPWPANWLFERSLHFVACLDSRQS